jgi:hypothetical protein
LYESIPRRTAVYRKQKLAKHLYLDNILAKVNHGATGVKPNFEFPTSRDIPMITVATVFGVRHSQRYINVPEGSPSLVCRAKVVFLEDGGSRCLRNVGVSLSSAKEQFITA